MSEAERQAALLAEARENLAEQEAVSAEAQRRQALLNSQVEALRAQLSELQALLDDAEAREARTEVQLQSLGNELNTALARVAAEERRRREAEEERARLLEAEAERLAAEKENLEKYRSDFFGRMRELLSGQEGVRIVGDRFVFSSEVLFAPGEAELSGSGKREIAKVAGILRRLIDDIPEGIDWVLQVDGHTDNVPLIPGAEFEDNWELSQARALSVVRYMAGELGFPPDRLSANGYGEYQPLNRADTPAARAQNRRIELKLTTR
jgi:chemotaxis protein MotB